jgi:hypothetical protein
VDCGHAGGCYVQNYVDQAEGPAARDFTGGTLTYNGHRGTDIALYSLVEMRKGIAVLAAATGVVKDVRDGMDDINEREADPASLADRALGNAVVLDHGQGWQTIYGHLRKHSVRVRRGERVEAGVPLGLVGLSGNTEFPHLHFELRHNGKAIDPYTVRPLESGYRGAPHPLWNPAVGATLAYRPRGVLGLGFAAERPTAAAAERGDYQAASMPVTAPVLTFWVRQFGPSPNDRWRMRVLRPDGTVLVEETQTPSRPQARSFHFIGRKRPAVGWEKGIYSGEFVAWHSDGKEMREVDRIAETVELQ